jgi:ankyrin repeat protein
MVALTAWSFCSPRGAEVNALDSWDNTTALIAASRYGYLACVEVLLAHGANVDIQDKNGKNALQIAESRGHKDVAAYLSLRGSTKG